VDTEKPQIVVNRRGGGGAGGQADKLAPCVISGFRHEVGEKCVLLGHYAASSSNFLPTIRDRQVVQTRRLGITITRCVKAQTSAILKLTAICDI
jgi:hypothetical protein